MHEGRGDKLDPFTRQLAHIGRLRLRSRHCSQDGRRGRACGGSKEGFASRQHFHSP
jgi:hypothetical protein